MSILSVCMIVKNEESNIKRCLDSLKHLRAKLDVELVIVDTGSSDRTVEICKTYTDKVMYKDWNNDFSDMRNFSMSQAKGDWLFIIDADEEVADDKEIIEFLKSNNDAFNGAAINLYNIKDSKNTLGAQLISPRIFRNGIGFRYEGKVHNTPVVNGQIKYIEATLYHYGYQGDDPELMEKKFLRTSGLLKKELEVDPNNLYYRYQLATSYSMHMDLEEAYQEMSIAYASVLNDKESHYRNRYIIAAYAKDAFNVSRYSECIEAAKFGLAIDSELIDLYYHAGASMINLGMLEEAVQCFTKHQELVDKYDQLKIKYDPSIQLYSLNKSLEVNTNIAIALFQLGEKEKSMLFYQKASRLCDRDSVYYENVFKLGAKLTASFGNFDSFKELFISDVEMGNRIASQLTDIIKYADDNFYEKVVTDLELSRSIIGQLLLIMKTNRIAIETDDSYNVDLVGLLERFNHDTTKDALLEATYFALRKSVNIASWIAHIEEKDIMEIMIQMDSQFNDLSDRVESYVEHTNASNIVNLNLLRIMCKYLAIKHLNSKDCEYFLDKYMTIGTAFIRRKYTDEFIDNSIVLNTTQEEAFLLYAVRYIEGISADSEVVEKYPDFEIFINYLHNKNKSSISGESKPLSKEMELLKQEFLKQIHVLISYNKIIEVTELINEYIGLMGVDKDIMRIKEKLENAVKH